MTDVADRHYEVSILIGPCSQGVAEAAAQAAHEAAAAIPTTGPATVLNYWIDGEETPGDRVPDVAVLG